MMSVNTCEKIKMKSEFVYTLLDYHTVVSKSTLICTAASFLLMNLDLPGTEQAIESRQTATK